MTHGGPRHDGEEPLALLGAYMLGGAPDPGGWYETLAADGLDGLEHPVEPDDPDALGRTAAALPAAWHLLLTTVSMTSRHVAADPSYGLASDDPDGRGAAVRDVTAVLGAAERLEDAEGRRRVLGVELHTAPGPRRGSWTALSRSLVELADVAPAGLPLVVEHCDAPQPGRLPAKGYLPLADEVAAVRDAVRRTGHPVRLGLNWGRSAIEGRSALTPVEHARTAAASGLLATAVLSGASPRTGAWGPAWSDTHVPPHGPDPALPAATDSLLGIDEARRFLAACGPVPVVAAKVAARPAAAPPAQRLAVARATVRLLRAACAPGDRTGGLSRAAGGATPGA